MIKDRLTILVVHAWASPIPQGLSIPSDARAWTGTVFGLGDVGFKAYQEYADTLQRNFDDDCDPVRVYVCRNGMPDYAALPAKRRNSHQPRTARQHGGRSGSQA